MKLNVLFLSATLAAGCVSAQATTPAAYINDVNVNPITHTATAVRGLIHGTVTVGQIGLVLASSAALIAVFGPITMYLYRKKQ